MAEYPYPANSENFVEIEIDSIGWQNYEKSDTFHLEKKIAGAVTLHKILPRLTFKLLYVRAPLQPLQSILLDLQTNPQKLSVILRPLIILARGSPDC